MVASNYTYVTLDDPSEPLGFSYALGINDLGQVVGFDQLYFVYSGGLYSHLPTGTYSPTSINDAGQIAGTYFDSSGAHGFVYNGGVYTTLPDDPLALGGFNISGINNAGQIVGSYFDSSFKSYAFVYSGGVYTALPDDPLATYGITASGINIAGQIVGSYYDSSGTHAFLYSGGVYTTLPDDPLAISLSPTGINDAGQIVGIYQDSSGGEHGFLYSGGVYTTIDDPLATSGTAVFGINDAGQVVGSYFDSSGQHAFVATPTALNHAPTANPDIASVQKGQTIAIDATHGVLSNDTDPDHDVLHVSAINGVATNVGHSVTGSYGTLTLAADGSYSYAANNNVGSAASTGAVDEFKYTIDDGHGGTATSELSINIDPAQASSPQHTPPTTTLADLISEGEQEITNQENTSDFSYPSHLTDNFHLVDDIANGLAAQFGTPQSHYVIGSTVGDVTDGFINVKSELSIQKDYPFLDQCVALVQALDKNVGGTTGWHPSTQVDANGQIANIAAGSPIATFTGSNYDGDHAALFLGAGAEKGVAGFFVLDQYNHPPASTGLTLYPDGTHLDVSYYEHAELRFISTADAAATHYFLLA
jgi:probable HAF family extracellular repeat protein/VCBS repeat-containing protein